MHIIPSFLQIYQEATNTLEEGAKLILAHPNEQSVCLYIYIYIYIALIPFRVSGLIAT